MDVVHERGERRIAAWGHHWSESSLLSAAIQLGAPEIAGWSDEEKLLAKGLPALPARLIGELRDRIRAGEDPLGGVFSLLRTPEERRGLGATYTPPSIVEAMLAWAQERAAPARVVDPGVGSARFLVRAAAAFSEAKLVGVEIDPLAAAMARANLAAAGLKNRSHVILRDYRHGLPKESGQSLFIGNPPYVRHHQIDPAWKSWLSLQAKSLGLEASQLAGLHVHFFLATALHARAGDCGAFITAAEWLDVNYGRLVRELFLSKLGGQGLVVVEPTATPFADAATTAAITFFDVGSKPASVSLRRVMKTDDLQDLPGGRMLKRERLEVENRWSRLTFGTRECPEGFVELGELCRVHRGQVTGANQVWIAGDHTRQLPERFLFPSITKARELISAGRVLQSATGLRSVLDLPEDLDVMEPDERKTVDRFLRYARTVQAHSGYVASHRRAWWSVGLRRPAPILATYMARRAPVFTRNLAEARHINIAHGLYPRESLTEGMLRGLVDYLCTGISVTDGRTYAGGLTKFEPGEMERLFVPGPALLRASENLK